MTNENEGQIDPDENEGQIDPDENEGWIDPNENEGLRTFGPDPSLRKAPLRGYTGGKGRKICNLKLVTC